VTTADTPEGHPLLAALLAEVPRLGAELSGWCKAHLGPALDAITDSTSEAQLNAAIAKLRKVLGERADADPWLGEIAKLSTPAEDQVRGDLPYQFLHREQHLRHAVANQWVVDQARRLVAALILVAALNPKPQSQPPQPRPDPKPQEQRRPVRAFVEVDDIADGPKCRMLSVFVPRWREDEAVLLPEDRIPAEIRPHIKKGVILTAYVNVDALRVEDLFFDEFELTPEEDLEHEPA
jgi:hypothetical protein